MKKFILSVLVVMFLVNCKNHENYENSVEVVTDEVADYSESKSINPEVEGKVFKSNAVINMKVADAFKIGSEIENNAIEQKGFILSNKFYTNVLDTKNVKISDDSLNVTDKLQKNNHIVLKVPVQNLRTHLKFALDKGLIINSVEIENEELTFENLNTDLHLNENKGLKTAEKIEHKVSKAMIFDNIKYATISYDLTQPASIVTYNSENVEIKNYQDINLGLEIKNALKDGVYYFKLFLVFIVQLLPTIIAIGIVVFLFKTAIKAFKNYKN